MSVAKLSAVLLLFLLSARVFSTEDDELQALMSMLDAETEVATRSKMNADFVPGMVTVLHGENLLAYGYRTVADALNNVAGFYISVNNAGDNVSIVRGVGASLSANNLKILIDGVALNRPVDASADWVFRLPLSQVDRIEVIRGPGAALYGEFAFSGVVNIISRKGNEVGVATGSHDLVQGHTLLNHQFDNGFNLGINLTGWNRDNSGRNTDVDNFFTGGIGYSPGKIYDREQGRVLKANLSRDSLNINTWYAEVERGGSYGRNAVMPFESDPRLEKVFVVDARQAWEVNPNLQVSLNVGAMRTSLEQATYLPIPKGADPPGPPPLITEDRFRQESNGDRSERAGVDIKWTPASDHSLYLALGYTHSEVDDSASRTTINGITQNESQDTVLVQEGAERGLSSMTLQDQWQIAPKLELTAGLRYDHYDDWGSNTSPRIAAVWRANDHHIFKLQYAEAFRPPTLVDQNPGPKVFPRFVFRPLSEENIASTEFAYIYHQSRYSLHATLFRNDIEDLIEFYIQPGQAPIWRNRGDISATGLELEWKQSINRSLEWYTNLSYVDANDALDEVDGKLVGSVPVLANIGLSWHSSVNVLHTVQWRYVGDQENWELNIRRATPSEFDAWQTLDYTLTVEQLAGVHGLGLKAGVNNLADKHYNVVANPPQYPLGLPAGERTWWAQLNYAF